MDKLINNIKHYFSTGPKVAFVLVLTLLGAGNAIDLAKKNVVISVDGKETAIVTFKNTFEDALKENSIVLGPKDKTSISLNNKINKNDTIEIEKAINVSVEVDGKQLEVLTSEDTVGEMLAKEGIEIRKDDKVVPSVDFPIREGLKLQVVRVDLKTIEQSEPIQFSTVVKNDEKTLKGKSNIVQRGQLGEKVITTSILYENGKEVGRKVIGEIITKQPVEKIVAVGTMKPVSLSRGGSPNFISLNDSQFKAKFTAKATAYTADFKSTGKRPGDAGFGRTATGTKARRNINGYSTVAVDPRVIPYGTKLYIEGYGYAIAEDTGGAIKGSKIDVFFNTNAECINWGVRNVNVYILK